MRKVLIVGAGQSGLQLALTLLEHDFEVTIMSARTPEEIREGRVMSTQALFGPALRHEREHKLNLWEEQTTGFGGIGVSIAAPDSSRALDWVAELDEPGQSVDQRVKMAGWLELFEERGGQLVIHGVTTADLDKLAGMYDLTIVAAGKGELVQLFDRDPSRSPYTTPQRALSLVYVHGVEPRPEHPDLPAVRFNIIPGAGELFMIPAFTVTGNCDILFFEGVPGGPLDVFDDRPDPDEHLRRILDLMKRLPAVGVRALPPRAAHRHGRVADGRLHPGGAPAGGGAAVGQHRVRHGRRGRGERPDHRAGLEQRLPLRGDVPERDGRPTTGRSTARGWSARSRRTGATRSTSRTGRTRCCSRRPRTCWRSSARRARSRRWPSVS